MSVVEKFSQVDYDIYIILTIFGCKPHSYGSGFSFYLDNKKSIEVVNDSPNAQCSLRLCGCSTTIPQAKDNCNLLNDSRSLSLR